MKKCSLVLWACFSVMSTFAQTNFSAFVNPFIGTGGHGHTYPGATLPHGMVQLSPDTRIDGWDGCSGYHYSDSFIYGFSHTHLSGTGVSDYGDVLLMPMLGNPSPDNKIYGSRFSHTEEMASPGFYQVHLQDDNIVARFTATERVGFHQYTFSNLKQNNLVIDLVHRDEVLGSSLNIEDSVTVSGFRRSRGWAQNQYVAFVMKFSSPIVSRGIWEHDSLRTGANYSVSNNIKAYLQFDLPPSGNLFVKVALSPVSVDGAKKNLAVELPGWDFQATHELATHKWNKELGKIEVETTDENQQAIFYTALYHTAIVPNINMDVDSMYRGRDDKIHRALFTNYSVFSLWDTYRAAHPLYTLIDRQRTLDYIKTFLAHYKEAGRLPVWELAGNETDCMIGYHSVPVIVDAFSKGIVEFDTVLALKAMEVSANWQGFGVPDYVRKGMLESADENESVSKTLEYAYDDYCIALFAELIGHDSTASRYRQRAVFYKNMLDPAGFAHPRMNGSWLQPFDPREVNNHFTEANSWQYSFYFPQDISGYLQDRGKKKLQQQLDGLFNAPVQTTGRKQSDITGLIGQYAHGNEPSHHIALMYNYAGQPYKAQQLINKIRNDFYLNNPDGLIGNEDCGQMSAWYVMNALGFYPVTPGVPRYDIGTPLFSKAVIHFENGKSFKITSNASPSNIYVQEMNIINPGGKPQLWRNGYLLHSDIMQGGEWQVIMSPSPSAKEFQYPYDVPLKGMITNPVIQGGGVSFRFSKKVEIITEPGTAVYYTLDGSQPGRNSLKYSSPLLINHSATIHAKAFRSNDSSYTVSARYIKLPNNWTVKLQTPFQQQYNGGGQDGLIDGIRGITDWRKGNWQGYQGHDFDAVIDLGKSTLVSSVQAGFLQDTRSWIIAPRNWRVEVSLDNIHFRQVYSSGSFLPIENMEPHLVAATAEFPPANARYIRVVANQFGVLPEWHPGAGGQSHIFIDEIMIH